MFCTATHHSKTTPREAHRPHDDARVGDRRGRRAGQQHQALLHVEGHLSWEERKGTEG